MGVRFTMWAVDAERLLDALTADEVSQAREDSLPFQIALGRVSQSSNAHDIVQPLLDGHRRWWIGSFLESLRECSPWTIRPSDVDYVESLLSSLLRGWNCGTAIRSEVDLPNCLSFPITPKCDVDFRFAVLSSSDFEFLRLFLIERLRDEDRRFVRPSGRVGIAPETDEEWDEWIRQVIREIATKPLEVPNPSLVSFIG